MSEPHDTSWESPPAEDAAFRLAAIVESSDDAIVSKSLDGIIRTWNKGAERIFGYRADEVIGKPITLLLPPNRQDEETHILARLRKGERVDHFETVRLSKDGREIYVSVTISPVRNAEGKIVGASKVARDISLQKRFERELREAKEIAEAAREQAEAASRAKDHFLSVLSHELRTPLTPVLGAISFMESNPVLSADELRAEIKMIRRNVETEARLVDDLLDLTRIIHDKVHLHFEDVDAHAVLRQVVSMIQTEVEDKGLAVTFALRAKDYHVRADRGRLQQVFLNVLSNAAKFTPAQGSITLRSVNEQDHLKIEIIDSGVGIEPEVLPRLFQAFEQGEQTLVRQFGGLGLGLSISRSFLGMHEGTITATSEGRDKGATFVLMLPTLAAPNRHALQPPTLSSVLQESDVRHHRVLLVEDHTDTRNVMSRLLKALGCTVTTASTVKEAIELSDRQTFDLLLSDIGLPDGSGMEVMRHMSSRSQVKGIAISGFGQDDDLRRSQDAGFETHLIKPINFQTLQDVIRKIAG